ncbi:MAG: aryl-sulfate sulfotransferase [Bacteroidota bacterium]|nr:aryl-sulfate sulfotransferase [Bacteroidota bacterium]
MRAYQIPKQVVLHAPIAALIIPIFMLLATVTADAQVKVNYTYPSANATQVSAKTTIGIRYAQAISRNLLPISAVTVTGSLSGSHKGKLILATDERTIIFTPDIIFAAGEKVQVSVIPIRCAYGGFTVPYKFSFQISKVKILPYSLLEKEDSHLRGEPRLSSSAVDSVPSDFPVIAVTKLNGPAEGNIYLSDFKYTSDQFGTYLMILDSYGHAISYHKTRQGGLDFRPQPNGLFTYFDLAAKKFYGLDSNYVVVDSFEAANGYETDSHELRILPNGGYALLGVYSDIVDMRSVISSGDSTATVVYNDIEEFDKDKNLVFDWRTNDHFAITDVTYQDFSLRRIDAAHCNAIELDRDGSFLLSSRSLDEITKINREDGSMIWRWGGKHNQFHITNDTIPFLHQHDMRRLANGNITIFDNGNFREPPFAYSRALEYSIDEVAKTATKVWEYRHDPDIFAGAMGSVQRLPNGNTLIGWGICDQTSVTEVKPDGSTAIELLLPGGHYNYRAYKFTPDDLKSAVSANSQPPTLSLKQNFPNPFTASSTIQFTSSNRTLIHLAIYDLLGREVRTLFSGTVERGEYSATFDAGDLPGGIYICKLVTPSTSFSEKMIITK